MSDSSTPLILGSPTLPDVGEGAVDWRHQVSSRGLSAVAAATRGSFALAMEHEGGKVSLATDRFGSQSLCWRVVDGRVKFSDRADTLGGTELDPQALFDYLFFHAIPSPRTVFKGVHRLPAAHLAEGQGGEISVKPYWQPRFEPTRSPSFDALKAEFRRLLRQAVTRSLSSGTPACFLSGGTDSSTVAGVIQEVAGSVDTYSIGFDAEGYDEMSYARIASRHFGARHHEYYVTPDDLVRSIPEVAASYDQPFGNSSALPAYYCARRAREDGVTRLLAGDGGDELFGGNSRYAIQGIYGLYDRVPAWLRKGVLEPIFANGLMARVPVLRKGSNYIRDAQIPLPDRLYHYNLLDRLGLADVLTPDFLRAIDPGDPLKQQRRVWALADADSDLNRMLAFDWRYTLAESDLPKVIGTTRLAGMEVAFPLLDDDLLAFSLSLPDDYKLRGMKLRWFFKEALKDFLPQEIITKTKKGFGLPFGVWTQRHAPLRELATDSLEGVALRGIVRPEFVSRLLKEYLPAHPGYYGEMVWILMMLEQWLRAHAPDWRHRVARA